MFALLRKFQNIYSKPSHLFRERLKKLKILIPHTLLIRFRKEKKKGSNLPFHPMTPNRRYACCQV